MWSSNPTSCLLLLFLLTSMQFLFASSTREPYIVYLGSHSHGAGNAMTAMHNQIVEDSHVDFLRPYLGSYKKAKEAIFVSYKREINGFAAYLDEHEADEIAKNPQVISVFLNQEKELQTMHSWDFMSVEKDGVVHPSSIWKKTRYGESAIIGSIDSGVWPESKSFNDEGYGPVPASWNGTCQNENDPEFRCNRKLIGAKYFWPNITSVEPPPHVMSPRDNVGHGSATLSVAGGSFVPGVSMFGMDNQTLKGGAPRARLSVYKACWSLKCYDAALLKAFDAAISDGVSVIIVAISQKKPIKYVNDSLSIGSFHAAKKGILVVAPAGNYGPEPETVINSSPWILTVAASTTDRQFQNMVELPNGVQLKGASLSGQSKHDDEFYPLITGADARASYARPNDAMLCNTSSLDPDKAKGKILVCLRKDTTFTKPGKEALDVGAAGMVLYNDVSLGNEISADPHGLPASHIGYRDSLALFEYMSSTKYPVGHITPPSIIYNTKPAPFMAASYSSVGPNIITPDILKPDVTAPGMNIVAARGNNAQYSVISGTSMSCPHVAGIAAIIKAEHPDWSAAAVKSAIMTTARTRGNTARAMVDSFGKRATPFHYGSGHLRPNKAIDPGLVYDSDPKHNGNFLCALGYRNDDLGKFWNETPGYRCPDSTNVIDLNYPSIMVPELYDKISFNRSVTNVGPPPVTYKVHIRQPPQVTVTVNPSTLNFLRIGEPKNFTITLQVSRRIAWSGPKRYVFGGMKWSDGKHHVRSPIVVGLVSQ